MRPYNFIRGIALDALRSRVPGIHITFAVEQIDRIVVNPFHDRSQLQIAAPHGHLRIVLLGVVADKTQHHRPRRRLDRLEQDVDRELGAVFAQPEQVHGCAHLPGAGMGVVILPVAGMMPAKPQRDEAFNRHSDQICRAVTKKLCCTRVRGPDDPLGVRDENCIWRNLEEVIQSGLSELGPYVLSRSRCVLFRGIRRAHDWLRGVYPMINIIRSAPDCPSLLNGGNRIDWDRVRAPVRTAPYRAGILAGTHSQGCSFPSLRSASGFPWAIFESSLREGGCCFSISPEARSFMAERNSRAIFESSLREGGCCFSVSPEARSFMAERNSRPMRLTHV